jgi:hypothetical protein
VATVTRSGDVVVVSLAATEKLEAVHGDLSIPVTQIRSIEACDEPYEHVSGLRVLGAGIPGGTAVGTFLSMHERTFAVVHRHMHRGVILRLDGFTYDEVILSVDDPEATIRGLGLS